MNTTCQYPNCGIPIKPTPGGKYCKKHSVIANNESNKAAQRRRSVKMAEEKPIENYPKCLYNPGVECDKHDCERCGFNPTEDERRRKLRRK